MDPWTSSTLSTPNMTTTQADKHQEDREKLAWRAAMKDELSNRLGQIMYSLRTVPLAERPADLGGLKSTRSCPGSTSGPRLPSGLLFFEEPAYRRVKIRSTASFSTSAAIRARLQADEAWVLHLRSLKLAALEFRVRAAAPSSSEQQRYTRAMLDWVLYGGPTAGADGKCRVLSDIRRGRYALRPVEQDGFYVVRQSV
jgi:hypothetical protein